MQNLFGKERALHLVENPTKIGFSWWFFFAGIITAYAMHKLYGDSHFVIIVVEKYVFLGFTLLFGFLRVWVVRRVKLEKISRENALLYPIPPFGYIFTFFRIIGLTHMAFSISSR